MGIVNALRILSAYAADREDSWEARAIAWHLPIFNLISML